jgi:hypothetical protein
MNGTLYPMVLTLVSLCPAASGDDAPPGRDGKYEFAGPSDLAGTMWKGDMNPEGSLVVRFERDGTVCYTYSGGNWRNGHWKQDGDKLHMVIGRAMVTFRAVIRDDNITGAEVNNRRRLVLKYVGPISKEEMERLTIMGP